MSKNDKKKTQQPKLECTIFLDRTHGKALGRLLRKVDVKIRSIYTVYPKKKHESTSDPTWIARCGKEKWVAISGDKRLETNVENRKAVIEAKAKVFILSNSNRKPEEWAAAVIVGRTKMANLINHNSGPFFATISEQSLSHVGDLRFPKLEPTPADPIKEPGHQSPATPDAEASAESESAPHPQ